MSLTAQRALDAALEPAWTRSAVAETAVTTKTGACQPQIRQPWQPLHVLDRQDRIVGRCDDPRFRHEVLQCVAYQRVPLQVVFERR
jgi:hypothetical protein